MEPLTNDQINDLAVNYASEIYDITDPEDEVLWENRRTNFLNGYVAGSSSKHIKELTIENEKLKDLLNQCYHKIAMARPHVGGLGGILHKIKNYKDFDITESGWNKVEDEPEFGGEYNVVYDLEDGGELLVTTMDYDKKEKVWIDVIGSANSICYTVKLWRDLPNVPKYIKYTQVKPETKQRIIEPKTMDDYERLSYGQCTHGENLAKCNICKPQ